MLSYLRFARDNWRFVAFGFVLTGTSSYGQTFFIGIFGPDVQARFSLDHTEWGTIYLIGTLASAMILPWTGKLIDQVDLRRYTLAVCGLAVLACLAMATAQNVIMLVVAIFLLRQSGQGLLSHIASTSMARYHEHGRGKALAIASFGEGIGEAILPVLAVLLIVAIGWRASYGVVAIILAVGLTPFLLWLLKGHTQRHAGYLQRRESARQETSETARSATRAEVLRDTRFWLLMPGLLAPAMIVTGLFFHHLNLADAKGWSHLWIAGNYFIYAIFGSAMAFVLGPLIDRFGAVRFLPWKLTPLILALVVVAQFNSPYVLWPYFVLLGISAGTHVLVTAMWAEIYGVDHLGAIKSLVTALEVFASAIGPVLIGLMLDQGWGFSTALYIFAGYSVAATVLLMFALHRRT